MNKTIITLMGLEFILGATFVAEEEVRMFIKNKVEDVKDQRRVNKKARAIEKQLRGA